MTSTSAPASIAARALSARSAPIQVGATSDSSNASSPVDRDRVRKSHAMRPPYAPAIAAQQKMHRMTARGRDAVRDRGQRSSCLRRPQSRYRSRLPGTGARQPGPGDPPGRRQSRHRRRAGSAPCRASGSGPATRKPGAEASAPSVPATPPRPFPANRRIGRRPRWRAAPACARPAAFPSILSTHAASDAASAPRSTPRSCEHANRFLEVAGIGADRNRAAKPRRFERILTAPRRKQAAARRRRSASAGRIGPVRRSCRRSRSRLPSGGGSPALLMPTGTIASAAARTLAPRWGCLGMMMVSRPG